MIAEDLYALFLEVVGARISKHYPQGGVGPLNRGTQPSDNWLMQIEHVSLEVVPRPEEENMLLIAPRGRGIVIRGGSDVGIILECGSCWRAMAEGVRPRQLRGFTLRCSDCGAYNRTSG